MYRYKFYIIIAVVLMTLSACNPVKLISTEEFTTSDPEIYQTFGFAEITKDVKVNRANKEKIEQYIRHSITEQMKEQGYLLVESDPDLLLDMDVILLDINKNEVQSNPWGTGLYGRRPIGYRGGIYDPYYWELEDTRDGLNIKARVTLTYADARARRGLWQGKAEANLSGSGKKRVARIHEAVDLLVEGFVEKK